jgi:hypothetical protein
MQYLVRNKQRFTNSRGLFDREFAAMKLRFAAAAVLIGPGLLLASAKAEIFDGKTFDGKTFDGKTFDRTAGRLSVLAQANIPPTGMGDKDKAMAAANMAEDERMAHRYPQPIRVGALIGARVSDNESRTIGAIRHVVRTAQGRIDVVVDCCGWFGFGGRQVVVPIAVLGALGGDVASLDWPRSAYAGAPVWQMADWQQTGGTVLADDDTVRIALARR